MHLKRTMIATCVAGAALLAGPAGAFANGGGNIPFIQYQNAISGDVQNIAVGTPLSLNYLDPSGATAVSQYCWSPAPLDRPACSASPFGAPAQAGTQTIVARLTNGQSVSTTFNVAAAPTTMGSEDPVPYTANAAITLSGDATLDTAIGQVAVGQPLGGIASPQPGVTEVYDYATGQTGYVPTSVLAAAGQTTKTYTRTIRLRSHHEATYHLVLPAGFEATGTQAVRYALFPSGTPSEAVTKAIGGGRRPAYDGAAVLGSSLKGNVVSLTLRTGHLPRAMTLRLSANGIA